MYRIQIPCTPRWRRLAADLPHSPVDLRNLLSTKCCEMSSYIRNFTYDIPLALLISSLPIIMLYSRYIGSIPRSVSQAGPSHSFATPWIVRLHVIMHACMVGARCRAFSLHNNKQWNMQALYLLKLGIHFSAHCNCAQLTGVVKSFYWLV